MATPEDINNARKFFGLKLSNPFTSKGDKIQKGMGKKQKPEDILKKAEELVAGFNSIYEELGGKNPFQEMDKIQKAFFSREKAHKEEVDQIRKAFNKKVKSLETSHKEEVETLQKGLDNMKGDLEKLLNAPRPRKSFENVQEIERFQKSKKSGGLNLSLSNNSKEISNLLFSKLETIQKGGGGSRELESAIINLEASGTLDPKIVELLAKDNVIITQ